MPIHKKVEEIMVPIEDYSTISENATIYEAIKVLQHSFHRDGKAWYGHRSVIVLKEDGTLSGILTLKGLLKAVGLRELDEDANIKAESWGWYFTEQLRKESKMRVKDVMRPLALATVNADSDVASAAMTLLRHQVNSLPVLKDGKPVGILRTLDIFMVIDQYF